MISFRNTARSVFAALAFCAMPEIGLANDPATEIVIHYVRLETPPPPTLSNLDPEPVDLGIMGAELGLADNNTTGKFLGQTYSLVVTRVEDPRAFVASVIDALSQTDLVVLDAPADAILTAADLPEAVSALLFNIHATDTDLRDGNCRANLLHSMASRDMVSDAMMQFFVLRRWSKIAMIEGTNPGDTAMAAAFDRSATKFGLKIKARKIWAFESDMRRNAPQEVPLFTQDLGEYDVLLLADEANDFARYIPYNTWLPRPVAGAEGLRPLVWDPVIEQWGAAQLQSRFADLAGRAMAPRDYAAWAAIRSISEAVTRTKASDAPTLRAFMLSDQFELAGFKGRALTYRDWNGQLRQPIALAHRGALVASAPLDGFLHQHSELDTLGMDRPESQCKAFQ